MSNIEPPILGVYSEPGAGKTEAAVRAFWTGDPNSVPLLFGRGSGFVSSTRLGIPHAALEKAHRGIESLNDLRDKLDALVELRVKNKARSDRPVVIDDYSILMRDWMEERKRVRKITKFEHDDWEAMNVVTNQVGDLIQALGSPVVITGHGATNKKTLQLEFEAGHGTARQHFLRRVDHQFYVQQFGDVRGVWKYRAVTIYFRADGAVDPCTVKTRYSVAPILPFNLQEIMRAWNELGLTPHLYGGKHPKDAEIEDFSRRYESSDPSEWDTLDAEARTVLGPTATYAWDRYEIRARHKAYLNGEIHPEILGS